MVMLKNRLAYLFCKNRLTFRHKISHFRVMKLESDKRDSLNSDNTSAVPIYLLNKCSQLRIFSLNSKFISIFVKIFIYYRCTAYINSIYLPVLTKLI